VPSPLQELLRRDPRKELQIGRYSFSELEDSQSLDLLFRQRHGVYVAEGFLEPEIAARGVFRDAYDPISIHIGARNPEGDVIGSSRIVPPSPLGLPTERLFRLVLPELDRTQLGEVGRLAIDRSHRGGARLVVLGLITRLYHGLRTRGMSHFVAFMHPDLARLLNRLGIPLHEVECLEPGAAEIQVRGPMAGYFERGEARPMLCSLDEMAQTIGV